MNIAFIDLPFINLLIIAHNVSNIGSPRTINGNTITAAVYVFAIPNIDIIDNENPKKFDPVSPINVFAGAKLNGKNPTNAPANAVINTIDINGEPFNTNIINNDIIKSIEANYELGNITLDDARRLKRYTKLLYEHLYAHYEEMEAMNDMTDESLIIDLDIRDEALKDKDKKIDEMQKLLDDKDAIIKSLRQQLADKTTV